MIFLQDNHTVFRESIIAIPAIGEWLDSLFFSTSEVVSLNEYKSPSSKIFERLCAFTFGKLEALTYLKSHFLNTFQRKSNFPNFSFLDNDKTAIFKSVFWRLSGVVTSHTNHLLSTKTLGNNFGWCGFKSHKDPPAQSSFSRPWPRLRSPELDSMLDLYTNKVQSQPL